MSEPPEEPRSWKTDEAAESVLETLQRQIEDLRLRVRAYRALLTGDEAPRDPDA